MKILKTIKGCANRVLVKTMDFVSDAVSTIISLVDFVVSGVARLFANPKLACLFCLLFVCVGMYAQNQAGNFEAGTSALNTVTEEIAKYVPIVQKLCYSIAGVVAIVGAISVYIAMNNEEQDVKKKIMMIVGACIFLIAAAQALPLFFGIGGTGN